MKETEQSDPEIVGDLKRVCQKLLNGERRVTIGGNNGQNYTINGPELSITTYEISHFSDGTTNSIKRISYSFDKPQVEKIVTPVTKSADSGLSLPIGEREVVDIKELEKLRNVLKDSQQQV